MLDYSKEKESMGEQVDPFDLTKKQEADLQRIRQFRLIDDVFMNKVFEDKSCVELLLQIILDRRICMWKVLIYSMGLAIFKEELSGWIFWR